MRSGAWQRECRSNWLRPVSNSIKPSPNINAKLPRAFHNFTDGVAVRTGTLEQIVVKHTETAKKIVAEMRVELTHTEATAKRIQNQLEAGVAEWQKARTDFMTERDRLMEKVIEIRNGYTQQEWFCVILILAAVFTFGIVLGMRIAR